jgi:hypothetical protein
MVKPLGHVLAIETLGRSGETKQFLRSQVVQEPVVRHRGSVMELVDDHDVEGVWRDLLQPISVERLDHREDVPALSDSTFAVGLAERAVAQHRSIGRQGLPEDLSAMSHEQQRQVATTLFDELPVIQRSDHGLACSGRGHDEIAVTVMAVALNRQCLEHPLLMRVWPNIEVGE